ncbi:MAG: hypothetical protein RJQ09_08155 [Cyclobacteriaceae bacterium]
MKKAKLVIRSIFLLYIVLSIVIGINDEKLIKEGFGFLWDKGIFNFYENMKLWGLFGFGIILIEFAIENIQIFRLKKELHSKETEIIKLKAQMFDLQTPHETPQMSANGEENSEEVVEKQQAS